MAAINQLMHELETLPPEHIQEVMNYVGYLKHKKAIAIPDTMFLSEKSLAKDWDTPEEDEAWADL